MAVSIIYTVMVLEIVLEVELGTVLDLNDNPQT